MCVCVCVCVCVYINVRIYIYISIDLKHVSCQSLLASFAFSLFFCFFFKLTTTQ